MKNKSQTSIFVFVLVVSVTFLSSCLNSGNKKLSFESLEYMFIPRIGYDNYKNEERLKGLIRFCKKTGVKEVMLVPVAKGEPVWLPEDKLVQRIDHTAKTIDTLNEYGIEASINVLKVLLPLNMTGQQSIFHQAMVNDEGDHIRLAPCPLDEKYRDYMRFFFSKLGETGACKVFVDDDFGFFLATHNACFCPLHIQEFNTRYGTSFNRKSIVKLMDKEPIGKLKREWLDFQADVLIELATMMEKAVHESDPNIRLGLMLTSTDLASYCGKTYEVVKAFAGDLRPVVRTGMGWYYDYNRRTFISELTDVVYQQSLLPENTEMYSEIDAIPHSQFSKGIRIFFDFQIKANLLCGMGTQSIWWLKSEEYLDEDYQYIERITRYSEVHRAIAEVIPKNADRQGIGIIENELGRRLFDEGPIPENRDNGEAVALWRMGIPITFGESETVILTKNSILFEPEKVERYFREKNILVDSDASWALEEIDLNELIDVESKEISKNNKPFISKGIKLLERGNKKIAVLPYSLKAIQGYHRHQLSMARKEEFKKIFEWLNGGHLPAFIDGVADVLPTIFADGKTGRKVVGLINCSYDPAIDCNLYIKKDEIDSYMLEYVTDEGLIKEIPGSSIEEVNDYIVIHLTEETGVNMFDVRVFTLIPVK
ncbi:hypothetical protein ACFLSA_06035 [Bacteroidota bacterium]